MAGELTGFIADVLDTIERAGDGRLTREWQELHPLMTLASVISVLAGQWAGRCPGGTSRACPAGTPVPYWPTEGLRDLDAAAKAAPCPEDVPGCTIRHAAIPPLPTAVAFHVLAEAITTEDDKNPMWDGS